MLRSTFKKITHFHITKAFAIVIILCCGTAWGATNYRWTGASGNGLWNTPGNWQSSATGVFWNAASESPTAGSIVYINSDDAGSTDINITLTSDTNTIDKLYLESSSATKVTITLNGYTLSANNLYLGNVDGGSSDQTNVVLNGSGTVTAGNITYKNTNTSSSLTLNNGAIVNSNNFTKDSTTISINGDGTSTLVVNGSQTGIGTSTDVTVLSSSFVWTGNNGNGDWSTTGNWTGNAVPTTGADVVIPNVSSHPTVTLNEATANLSSLTIAYGMTLVCNNKNVTATTIKNSGSIKLSGAETVTATKTDLSGSTIEYTGSANSSIWGNSYYNLTVSGGTLTLTENTTVAGSLSVTTGATLVTGNYTLTVNDTTTNSGTISATGSGTLEFNGSVTNTSIISCETGSITFSDAVTNTSGTLSTTSGKIINSYTSGQSFVGTVKITTAGGSVENSSTAALTVANLNLTAAGTLNATSGDITVTNLTNTTPSNISILGSKTVTLPAGSAAALIVGDGSTTTAAVLSGDFSATSVTVKSNAKLTATTGTLTCTGDFTNSGNSLLNNTTLSPSSSITITGTATASATSFGTLTCTGAGGKTLKIGGAITVGTIDLSGTSALSLLTVNSNAATDSITLATANTTAQYLSIGGVSGSTGFGPKIITRTITANNSKSYTTSGSLPAGWYFSSYTWTGATADWSLASNWDCNAVPVSSSDVVTIPASSSYTNAPLYSSASNTTINSITLDDSTSKLTLSAAGNIKLSTASSLSNAGTIIYSGAGRITDSSPTSAFINDVDKGTVEYKNANTITDFDTGTGNDYFNLVIDTGAIATLGGNISVGKKLTINGTVDGAYVLSVVGDAVIAAAIGETTPITSISVTGASSISANIKTTGTQTYSGNVTLGANTTFTSTGTGATDAIIFGTNISNTISGTGKAISVATAGAVTFNSKIATSTTDAIGNISQTGDGSVTFNGAVYAGAISDTGSGTVTFANPVTATSIEITGVAAINTTSVTTTGAQTYAGAVTLGANTALESTTSGDISFGSISTPEKITCSDKTLSVTTGSTGTVLFSGGFVDSASLTVIGNVVIYGNNTFSSLTVNNASLASSTTVKFEGEKLQTIGTHSFRGNSETNKLTLHSTDTNKWKANFTTTPVTSNFQYVIINNSSSVESGGTIPKDLNLIPSSTTVKDSNPASPTCLNWFTYTYHWIGTTNSSWTTLTNWTYSNGSAVLAYPPYSDSTSEIVINTIATTGTDLDLEDGLGSPVTTALALKSLTINANKRIGIGSCTITTSGNITNNGTVALYGTQTTPLSSTGGTISHDTASTIEYYGTGTATDVISVSTLGTTKSYYNLLLNKTGGTMEFTSAVNAVTLTTNQSAADSATNLYTIIFDGTVTVTGNADAIFGRGNDTSCLTRIDVVLKDNITVASTDKLTFWGNVTLSKNNATLSITNSGNNIYFNKTVSSASSTSLALSAVNQVQFRATDSSNSLSGVVDLTVSNGTTNISSKYTIEPSGTQSFKTVTNAGTITVATAKTLTVTGDLTNSGTITGSTGTIEIGGNYSSTGSAAFAAASATTTTFKGNVDFTNTTFTHNNGTVVFAGSSSQTLTATDTAIFYNVTINSGASVTTSSSFTVANNWTNNGKFNATTGTITFTGVGSSGAPIVIAGNTTLANSVFSTAVIQSKYVTLSGNNTFTTATFSGTSSAIHFAAANTFETLAFTGAGSTVKFGAGKTQTVNTSLKSTGTSGNEITLTTDATTPSITDTTTWWIITVPYEAISTATFNNTNIQYSASTNNLIRDWGATVVESVEASTSNWFIRIFYWYGKTNTSWTTPSNWSSSSTVYEACSFYPPYEKGLSEIVIAANNTNILKLTDTSYTIKSMTVNSGILVDLSGKTVVTKDTSVGITNNGTILMSGSENLSGVGTKNNVSDSTIQYYGTVNNTTFSSGWGNTFQSLVFANTSSVSSSTALTVNGTINILSSTAFSLTGNNKFTGSVTINAGNAVSLTGANTISNGVTITAGGAVTIKTTTGFSLASGASCSSLVVNGTVTLNGNVTTTDVASQTYNGAVTLTENTTLIAGTNTVTFNGKVDGAKSLTIGENANKTNVIFNANVGESANIGALIVYGNATLGNSVTSLKSSSNIKISGNAILGTSTTSFTSGGVIEIGGTTSVGAAATITSTGAQTYSGAVTFGENTTLLAGINTVTFNGTVSGANSSLTIGENTNKTNVVFGNEASDYVNHITALKIFGNARFNSQVGNTNVLDSIKIDGATTINTSSITTTEFQTYVGAVTLEANTTITAGSTGVSFNSTVDGPFDLSFASSTAALFNGAVGSTTPIHNLTTVGTTSFGNSFAQKTTSIFTISSSNVTFGANSFSGGKLIIATGASFTQTGININTNQTVSGIENNGFCIWDSGRNGGSLNLNGSITGTNKTATNFNNKTIYLSSSCTFNGILNNAELISSDNIVIGNEITIKDTLNIKNTLSYKIPKINFNPDSPVTAAYIFVAENKNLIFDSATTTNGNMNLILSDKSIFKTSEDSDITLTDGDFIQTVTTSGIANIMLAGGIITNGTHKINIASDIYTFGAGGIDSEMKLGGGSGSINCTENIYFATGSGKNTQLNSSIVSKNFILLSGKLIFNSSSISTSQDLVLLNGNAGTIFDDTVSPYNSGIENLFNYIRTSTETGSADSSLSTLPTSYPDGTSGFPDGTTNSYAGSIDTTSLNGKTFNINQNFYCNGVYLDSTGNWFLKIKDNEKATNAFAEIYNSSISNCKVSSIPSSKTTYLSAAENVTSDNTNTNIFFSRPIILKNDISKPKRLDNTANLSGTYTVFDDVIRIEFVDSKTGNSSKIENSNNEISKAIQNILFSNGNTQQAFEGSYIDADCTTSTDGKGDIAVFFLKVNEDNRWNTDANGISAGDSESTDSGRTELDAIHRKSIPYLNIPKALSSVYQTLRDEHKNRIGHYYSSTPDLSTQNNEPGKTFTGTEDRCYPVLIAVRTGQELHTQNDGIEAHQPYYDSHNFIELQYSEPVNTGAILLTETDEAIIQNTKTTTNFCSIDGTAGNGLTISALIKTEFGRLKTYSSSTGAADNTVHSIYRKFSTTANGTDSFQTHKIRIGIASYVDDIATVNGNTYKHWDGYIEEAEIAGGKVTRLSSKDSYNQAQIYDGQLNPLDEIGTTVHTLPSLSVDSTKSELYGDWDVSAPDFALYHNIINEETGYEAIGTSSVENTTLDRIEFHIFDNTDNPSDWYIRTGWSDNTGTLYKDYSYAADIFGGSRPFDDIASNRTSGGIRYSSIYNKYNYFTYNKKGDSNIKNFKNTYITGGAKGILFLAQSNVTHPTGNEDGLYFSVYLEDTTIPLKTTFDIQFNGNAYITDLAGNRMKSKSITTIDRTPPTFNISVGAVPNNDGNEYKELYLIFNKSLNTKEINIFRNRAIVEKINFTEAIRRSLIFIDSETGLKSDLSVSPTEDVSVKFQNNDFTGLLIPLNRSITYEDIKKLWIQAKIDDSQVSADPLSGIENAHVTFIQDAFGNYLSNMSAHALTDFAVNIVNPIYAYDNRLTETNTNFSTSIYQDGSWSVHDWNAEQKNYGTLSVGYDLFIMANLNSGDSSITLPENIYAYFDSTPDSSSVSEIYNKNKSDVVDWRIWLPNHVFSSSSESSPFYLSIPFKSLADYNNSTSKITHLTSKGIIPSASSPEQIRFDLSASNMNNATWKSGNQISFLFELADSTGAPITICHSPEYNPITGTYTKELSPLFSLRLKTPGDLSSLDLWSFKLQDVKKQRGGVTILNNVINANNGEKTIIQVNLPSSGSLNVIVMTLDGNIVQYLQHGDASEGEHFYTWNGTTKSGKKVARGLYFVRIFGCGIDETRKVMVVK